MTTLPIVPVDPQPQNRQGSAGPLRSLNFWGYLIFWVWNVIFIVFVLAGFTPFVLLSLFEGARAGLVPPIFFITAAAITFIPVACCVLGLTVFRSSGKRLLAFGYGVEAPIMLILLFRLFAVRQSTPAVTMLMVVAALGVAALLWQLLDRRIDERGALLTHLRTTGATLLLMVGVYVAAWLAFYTLPVAGSLLSGIATFISDIFRGGIPFDRMLLMGLSALWFALLAVVFGTLTSTLFIGMPVALVVLAVRAWTASLRALARKSGAVRPVLMAGTTAVVCALAFVWANQQPQGAAYALVQSHPKNIDQARAILAQRDQVRAGLVNAYLAPFRYLGAVGEAHHIEDMYRSTFALDEASANVVRQAYEFVSTPFMYRPSGMVKTASSDTWEERSQNSVFNTEPAKAAELYQQIFDEPINQAERDTIVEAARSTWQVDQAQAAWQAVDEREVHLVQQAITVTEHGDWASVELFEGYQNETAEQQEVVYYFSMPESTVMTGLWLNIAPDKKTAWEYRVSPRGAAQQAYKNEVTRRVDPALLEQIGPRQYRLRVFPIAPRTMTWDERRRTATAREGDKLYVWMTWSTLGANGAWPMAQLTDKRNVFWDAQTARTVNGKPASVSDAWLPATVPAASSIEPKARTIAFDNGSAITLKPMDASALPKLPASTRLAIVIDRSYSMGKQAAALSEAVAKLKGLSLGAADVFLTASAWRGEAPSKINLAQFDPSRVEYMGGQRQADLLAQFEQLRNGAAYDAILVLTDRSGYEQGDAAQKPTPPDAPLWMVHLDGKLSYGYDDALLEAIQASGGGSAGSLDEALGRIAIGLTDNPATMRDWIDGYEWKVVQKSQVTDAVAASDPFATIAARRLILAEMRRNHDTLKSLAILDQLHAIAKQQAIVTPFSSMIVLVSDAQQKRLDELENNGDRFERETEAIGKTPVQVTGVPEPHEWVLMGLAALMLGAWWWRRRKAHPALTKT